MRYPFPPMGRLWREAFPVVSLIGLLGVVTGVIVQIANLSTQRVLLAMLVTLVAVVGLYVFSGTSGILSFGHVSFMAIGAYVSGLLTIPKATKASLLGDIPAPLRFLLSFELDLMPALLIACAITLVLAVLIAVPLMRLSGIHAALATVAILVVVQVTIRESESITRGRSTLVGIPRHTSITIAFIAAAASICVAYLYQRSAYGIRLQATREDVQAATALGISPLRERVIAFSLSAVIMCVSGALYAHMLGQINPVLFYFHMTFVVVSMLIIGGIRSLAGAVVGVLVITLLTETLRRTDAAVGASLPAGLTESVLALSLLVIMVLRPQGIMAGRELRWPAGQAAGGAARERRRPGA